MRCPIRFTDMALNDIAARLAAFEPERGGALLAAGGLVHHLVEDVEGRYTPVQWEISRDLTRRVQTAELASQGQLVGTVHTHPAGTPDPSGPDIAATRKLLRDNPHIDQALVCVVTEGPPRDHDLPIADSHRMSIHVVRRSFAPEDLGPPRNVDDLDVPLPHVRVTRATADIVPIGQDLRAADVAHPSAWFEVGFHGLRRLALPLDEDDRPLLLLVPEGYPMAGPLVVEASGDGDLVPIGRQNWDPTQPSHRRLTQLMRQTYRRRVEGFGDRIEGLAGQLGTRRVLVAGAGSVGSWIVEELTRAGVGHLDLIDPELVDASNLARTTYETTHLDSPKVAALAELCARINPAIAVTTHQRSIGEVEDQLPKLCAQADLIVAATDDPTEQALLCHHAYAAGTPLVACALYRRAEAGEVVLVVPGLGTPCWVCATGARGHANTGEKDYGTGRLVGELALGPSIHLVAEVAASVSIGLLAGPEAPAGAAVTDLLISARSLGLISTAPGWDFFPKVFQGLEGHQWAPQSIWARVKADEQCSVCGHDPSAPIPSLGTAVSDVIRAHRTEVAPSSAATSGPSDQALRDGPSRLLERSSVSNHPRPQSA